MFIFCMNASNRGSPHRFLNSGSPTISSSPGVLLLVRFLEPFECGIEFAAIGIHLRDRIRVDVALRLDCFFERSIRFLLARHSIQ